MKLAISTAAMCLLLGAPAFAQQPEDKPKQEEPRKQEETKKQEETRRQEDSKHQQQTDKEKQTVREKQTDNRDGNRTQERETTKETTRTTTRRIPDDRFRSNFGREHRFHFERGWGEHFEYGGFGFALAEPWPSAWSYDDYVYVDFIDGQYYLVNLTHPEVRLLVTVNP